MTSRLKKAVIGAGLSAVVLTGLVASNAIDAGIMSVPDDYKSGASAYQFPLGFDKGLQGGDPVFAHVYQILDNMNLSRDQREEIALTVKSMDKFYLLNVAANSVPLHVFDRDSVDVETYAGSKIEARTRLAEAEATFMDIVYTVLDENQRQDFVAQVQSYNRAVSQNALRWNRQLAMN